MRSYVLVGMLVVGMGADGAHGQAFPNKPVRIVTAEVGGGSDVPTRIIARGISAGLGQQVIVENRGGQGSQSAQTVAKATPDGYTMLTIGASLWLLPFLQTMPYDPVKDFSPITIATTSPNVVVVHPSVQAESIRDLIGLAKANPGKLNYGSGPGGTSPHLAAELFKSMAGIDLYRIPYKGSGPAMTALIGGQVQVMFPNVAGVPTHVKAGRIRALAVASAQPSPLLPGLPTVASTGVPGYEAVSVLAVLAPAKTPTAIINRLNQEIVRFLQTPEAKEQFFNSGAEAVGNSPQQFAATMKSEMVRLGKVIKDAGIKID